MTGEVQERAAAIGGKNARFRISENPAINCNNCIHIGQDDVCEIHKCAVTRETVCDLWVNETTRKVYVYAERAGYKTIDDLPSEPRYESRALPSAEIDCSMCGHYGLEKDEGRRPWCRRHMAVLGIDRHARFHVCRFFEDAPKTKPVKEVPAPAAGDADIIKEAMEILKNGNPMEYLRETVNEIHVGDEQAIRAMIITLVCASVANSAGIHPALCGESGKGKSDLAYAVAHIAPAGRVLDTSVSPMALYYASKTGEIQEGTIILSDDTTLSEDMRTTIKRCTTNFQRPTYHKTVIKNKPVTLTIPARIGWWLASVDLDESDQILNRQIPLDVDASEDQDVRVFERQRGNLKSGGTHLPEDRRTHVAREVLRQATDGVFTVEVPYADRIEWNNKQNRRNFPVFCDVLRCYAVLNRFQRDTKENTIIATEADFEAAKKLYCSRAETQADKLTDVERHLIRFLVQQGEATKEEIAAFIKKSDHRTYEILHGKNNNGGLMAKVPGLSYEKQLITETVDPREGIRRGRPKNVYILKSSEGMLSTYCDVVYLK